MLAVVSATYEFFYVDVGQNGRMSDGRSSTGVSRVAVWACHPQRRIRKDSRSGFVADEAFALANHLMWPFPMRTLNPDQRIFNFCLSRARRVVENTFGTQASQFRLFLTPIHMAEYKLNHIVLVCYVIHNFLKKVSVNYAVSVGQQ
ncbi:uncharacterized protein LOC143929932 [Lithobates pipiens]